MNLTRGLPAAAPSLASSRGLYRGRKRKGSDNVDHIIADARIRLFPQRSRVASAISYEATALVKVCLLVFF